MTRDEHIAWVKERAKQEYEYYSKKVSHADGVRNARASILSDMGKHPETVGHKDATLILMLPFGSKQELYTFIDSIR